MMHSPSRINDGCWRRDSSQASAHGLLSGFLTLVQTPPRFREMLISAEPGCGRRSMRFGEATLQKPSIDNRPRKEGICARRG
jgi:hypothetical protein